VMFTWYANQSDRALAPSRGQLYDHVALSVPDLDAWIAKLRGEGVTFLEAPYPLGDTRAVMIEGPSREAIELVESFAGIEEGRLIANRIIAAGYRSSAVLSARILSISSAPPSRSISSSTVGIERSSLCSRS